MNLNIDLTKIRDPRKGVFNEIAIGTYSLSSVDGNLVIKNGEKIIAEYKNDDWFFGGYSMSSIWKTLENHYEAILTLQGN